jgi:predicted Rossmann fold flavoprotein
VKIAVIGAGAAGYFAAISVKKHHPMAQVQLLEKSTKMLVKVKVSGGGRCNVTHNCHNHRELAQHYPRGEKFMRQAFTQFDVSDTIAWFESRGVALKVESDNRMFPSTNDSQTIIDCLVNETVANQIQVRLKANAESITPSKKGFDITVNGAIESFDKVIIAAGGSPKKEGLLWLEDLGQPIVDPLPSLFTFNMPNESIKKLMGLSVPLAEVKVKGTKLSSTGPLLITHWGMSGPTILKTSAFGARELADMNYNFTCLVNWVGGKKEHEIRAALEEELQEMGKRKVINRNPFHIPNRLWEFLIEKAEIAPDKIWMELGKKPLNKLINTLVNDEYEVKGKTTFKEEFVTAGGVDQNHVDPKTMQSKTIKGLYFAGEILDIDGVTGGFNFQAAWTTGFIAGKLE